MLSASVLGTVVLITAIAPLATDMYVPAFPLVGRDLDASATQVQLTLTTFFVGMALGQLVGGPFSDRVGRRRPLLAALAVLVVASVVCAFSPSVMVMMAARLVQGFAGGWAMVIARSVVVDLTEGARMVRAMNLVAAVAGVAPIVGPLLGALVLSVTHWRVSFWVVAALAGAMLLAVLLGLPESLPAERRHGGGLGRLLGATGEVLSSRVFTGHLVVFAFSMGTTFAYVATSAYVLQSMNGLTPLQYSIDFAANAGGMTLAALVAARYADRVPTRAFVKVGLLATGAAGVLLTVGRALVLDAARSGVGRLLRPHDRPRPRRPQRRRARLGRCPRAPRDRVGSARVLAVGDGRNHRAPGRPRRRAHGRTDGHHRPGPDRRLRRRLRHRRRPPVPPEPRRSDRPH